MPRIDLGRVVGEVDTNTIIPFDPSEKYSVPMSGDTLGVFMGKVTTDLNVHDSAIGRSDAFSEEIDYTKGAYCIKEDMVYRFTVDKPKGAWDPEKVESTNIITELTSMRQELSALNGKTSNVFSFEESRIGTWVDGKPLYRKMINYGNLPSSGYTRVPTGVENVDVGYINLGHSFWGNLTSATPDRYTFVFEANINSVAYNSIGNDVIINVARDSSEYQGYICFEYTKTTDLPGQ